MNNDITIVIPYFNTPGPLHTLLNMMGDAFPIIVINNASKEAPQVPKNTLVINNALNYGFSHACNQALMKVNSPFVLFLNPDIAMNPEDVESLLALVKKDDSDVASPLLVDNQGQLQVQYHQPLPNFLLLLAEYTPLRRLVNQNRRMAKQSVFPGACLLARTTVLKRMGGWDERFWLWWEDVDLSKRLYDQRIKTRIFSDLFVKHQGGASFSILNDNWKRAVFFHSLRIYSRAHLSQLEASVLARITKRFSTVELYPADENIRASIIVPNVDPELLERFLNKNKSFLALDLDEIIIVSSADIRTIQSWRERYPQIIFVSLEKNSGFAPTVNVGLRRARGQYLITVNDDVILNQNWVEMLLQEAKGVVGSVSPVIISPDGKIESAGVLVLDKGQAQPLVTTNYQSKIDTFNAAAVLMTRPALEKVGLFDERFGSYLEDIDLGLRMSRAGFEHVVATDLTVIHQRHQTTRRLPIKKSWLDFKNWFFVVLKNWSLQQWLQAGPQIVVERLRNANGVIKSLRGEIF